MSSHVRFPEAFQVVQPLGQTLGSLQVSLGAVGQPIIAATQLQTRRLRVQQLGGAVRWTLPDEDSWDRQVCVWEEGAAVTPCFYGYSAASKHSRMLLDERTASVLLTRSMMGALRTDANDGLNNRKH